MSRVNLSTWMYGISGKTGNSVFVRTREGIVLRQRVIPANPDTPAQQGARGRFKTCSQLFEGFTQAQEDAWAKYGATIITRDNVTMKSTKRLAMQAYMALATKWLQVNGSGTPPSTPPTSEFPGDNITLSVSYEPGTITFDASAANASGVKTEILLQPIANQHRNPQKGAYRSVAFVAFASGSLRYDLEVPEGWYAAAYRFVKTSTGQTSKLQTLPVGSVSMSGSVGVKQSQKKAA